MNKTWPLGLLLSLTLGLCNPGVREWIKWRPTSRIKCQTIFPYPLFSLSLLHSFLSFDFKWNLCWTGRGNHSKANRKTLSPLLTRCRLSCDGGTLGNLVRHSLAGVYFLSLWLCTNQRTACQRVSHSDLCLSLNWSIDIHLYTTSLSTKRYIFNMIW